MPKIWDFACVRACVRVYSFYRIELISVKWSVKLNRRLKRWTCLYSLSICFDLPFFLSVDQVMLQTEVSFQCWFVASQEYFAWMSVCFC